jgi:hypothetical protein
MMSAIRKATIGAGLVGALGDRRGLLNYDG